jgi:hypothetical protein
VRMASSFHAFLPWSSRTATQAHIQERPELSALRRGEREREREGESTEDSPHANTAAALYARKISSNHRQDGAYFTTPESKPPIWDTFFDWRYRHMSVRGQYVP